MLTTADLLAEAEALAADDENAGVVYCRTCDRLVRVGPTNPADLLHTTWECYGIGMASGHLVHCVQDDNCPHLFTYSHDCHADTSTFACGCVYLRAEAKAVERCERHQGRKP